MQRRNALILPFLFCLSAVAQTRADLPPAQIAEIDRIVSREMSRAGVPGVSVAIVIGRQIRYANGFGLADLENYVPAKAETVYRLGSISKPVTATAVMQLVAAGKIDLDAPVQKYVPSFPEKPWPVTIRQLLGHLAGIRHYANIDEVNSTRHYDDVLEPLNIFKNDPLLFEPGTKSSYSSYGYNLLGAAVESASGEKFTDYLKRHIFDPAGMDRMRPDSVADLIPNRAQGYRKLPNGQLRNSDLADTSNKAPAGGLVSTVVDLAKFAIAIQSGKLAPPDTLELMFTSQKTKDGEPTRYGYGWAVSTLNGKKSIMHSGGQQRITTLLLIVPENGFALAWMCNLENARMDLVTGIAKLLLE